MEEGNGDEPRKPKFRRIADIIMEDINDPEKNQKNLKTSEENPKDEEEPPPPVFHPTILEEVDDVRPVFLFEKDIKQSDLNKHLRRFRITKTKIVKLLEFLTEEERTKVETDGLTVIAREVQSGAEYTMHLTKDDKEDDILVLKHEWRKFVLQSVQAWGYRRGGHEFRLALNFIKKTQQEDTSSNLDST